MISVVLLFICLSACGSDQTTLLYRDPDQPIEKRVKDLLKRMTLEEKVGQMNMPCVYHNELGRDKESKFDGVRQFAEGTYVEGLGPGGGFFTLANTILHEGPVQQAEFYNELQRLAIEKTRLGIPLIEVEEGTHGLMCSGGTIFPEGLGIGGSWNVELVERIYAATAAEGRAIGVHEMFTLVIEPNRDPRLGRNEEGYAEDPFLCARIAAAIVRGAQGEDIAAPDKVVAGLCHYPGQSQPVSGLERGAMEISERVLREVFLPPWVAGIKEAGALGVMATYPAIEGVPVHKSKKILTDILRGELGFEGLVLGEGSGLTTLVYEGVAADQKEAGAQALAAGVDVGISFEPAYMGPLMENVREGTVPMELIDRAVGRILTMKFRLGLFERPYVDPDRAARTVHNPDHQELALQAAREGIVLLKNEGGLLPIDKGIGSIAVFGPNADHDRNQLGDYIANEILQDIVTVLEGIKGVVSPRTRIVHVKGCNVFDTKLNEIRKAADAARKTDVAVVVVGENERRAPDGTNGEGKDVASLDLTGRQRELIQAVVASGTPTVVVLINGRPLSVRWTAEHVPAIIEAWNCGERGGEAIADVLFGNYNPSGHLPITIPRHVGQLPVYYNYKPSKYQWINRGWAKAYVDIPATPLYPFGHGLSYTEFEYGNLQISPAEIDKDGVATISLEVSNTGDREGADVVQLYVNDVLSSMVTPVIELKGFEKIVLKPGETKTVKFELSGEDLALLDEELKRVTEPGIFEIMIGKSSAEIVLRDSLRIVD
ncbi:glycoside hydrolase family 3 C-terminal domain-containing protein [candidate division KSB1 bacterium]